MSSVNKIMLLGTQESSIDISGVRLRRYLMDNHWVVFSKDEDGSEEYVHFCSERSIKLPTHIGNIYFDFKEKCPEIINFLVKFHNVSLKEIIDNIMNKEGEECLV